MDLNAKNGLSAVRESIDLSTVDSLNLNFNEKVDT
jgi:hypothetical protein